MLLAFTITAFAAVQSDSCPAPHRSGTIILDDDAAPDGAAYVLTEGNQYVCWWVIAEGGDGTIRHRWSRQARFPTRVEALSDGRAVFVMDDLRLQIRHPDDREYRNLALTLPGNPDVVLAHGRRDWLAVTVPVDSETNRALLIDIDREKVIASIALPSQALSVSFVNDQDVLYLDGAHSLVLSEMGFTALRQSP